MGHIIPVPSSTSNVGMASLDYIAVFALHIPHRPMLYASFSSFLCLLRFLLNVSWSYAVDWEVVEQEDVDQGSRTYEVGTGCCYDASWEVISTQRMVGVNVVEEVNLSTILLELLKAIELKVPSRAVAAADSSGVHSSKAPLDVPMMESVVVESVVNV